jgi:uncharacterized protein YhaN
MNLASLKVKNYGKFKDFECDFAPGLNVIKGGNETGKSTLVKAITKLLYSDPQTSAKTDVINAKSWGADGPLILQAAIESQDFSGTIEKDFEAGSARLANDSLNVTIDDGARIAEILSGAIGFSSEELFEATSCIKQGEISHIEGSIKAIKDKLESLVTGGKEEKAASQIIDKIEQRMAEISRRDDNNPGLIQKLETTQHEIDYNIEKLNRDINNIKSWRGSLAQVEIAYANGVEDFESKNKKLEEFQKAFEASENLKKLDTEYKDAQKALGKIKDAGGKILGLEKQLLHVVDIPKKDRNTIDELESTLKYLKPKYRELEMDVGTDNRALEEFKSSPVPLILAVISFLGVGFAIADFFMFLAGLFIEVGAAGLIGLVISLLIMSRSNAKKLFLKEQLKEKSQKLEAVNKEIEDLSEQLDDLLSKYHISSADEVRQTAWKRGEIENQLKAEKQTYNQYLDGYSMEEWEIKLQNYEKEIFDNKILLQNHDLPDASELERLKLIVGQLAEQKDNLEREFKSLSRQVDTAEGGSELLASYNERKEALGRRMTDLVEELAILNLTKECIEKARQDVMISTLELLEKRTSEILDLITGGKYNKVRFDKSSLKFEVFSPEKNGWVEPQAELSQATVEQIYLTARLALTEILGEKSRPPIILDDTFEHFDPTRHEGAMKLLKQMAENRQIFLLTSDNDYDSWADHTIQL